MKAAVILTLALAGLSPSTVLACSVPRETLADFTPQLPEASPGTIRAQIVLEEVQIARSDLEARRGWYGIRATVLRSDGPLSVGDSVVAYGSAATSCFYPGAAYDRGSEGQLIGWIKMRRTTDPAQFEWVVTGAAGADERIDTVWAKIRFPLSDDHGQ